MNRPPVKRLPSASREAKALNAMLAARSGRAFTPGTSIQRRQRKPNIALSALPAPTAPSAPAAPPASPPEPAAAAPPSPSAASSPPMTMDAFLDRLMLAESGGRATAKNPRSTALGPFQFIESTFLTVARRYFAADVATLSPAQILALRTDMAFSRKAAEAYTRENAAHLQAKGVAASFPNLRLAFLLGPGGAVRVLQAAPDTPLQSLLGPAVLIANPFMVTMTAHGLASRAAREVNQPVSSQQGLEAPAGTPATRRTSAPAVPVFCNLRLPSCKRWLALQTAKVRGTRKPAKVANTTSR